MGLQILAVNPGSTSTKLAIYEDTAERWRAAVAHRSEDLARLPRLGDQLEYRRAAVRARPGEIAQAILNLARNAIDGCVRRGPSAAEPLVRLAARGEGRRALVEVHDNAGGVPAAQVPRLFQPGGSTRGSTGVGLYLARCLAERNGGTLAYRPADGGSCFTLELPRSRPGPASRRRDAGGTRSLPVA